MGIDHINYGFIGIGAMGYPMASRLRSKMDKESTLVVYDVNSEPCNRLKEELQTIGPVVIASSIKEVVESSDIILSIVTAAKNVREVYLDSETGVLAAAHGKYSSKLFMECSTIDADTTRQIGKTVEEAGLGRYVDTPVSGGVPGAVNGTLSFILGCVEDDPVAPTVSQTAKIMGRDDRIFYCGPLGAGLCAKLANNYLCGVHLLAACEAMNFGIRSGVNKKVLFDVIQKSTGQSFMLDHVCPVGGIVPHVPSSNNYKLGFKTQLMIKDVSLGVEAAQKVKAKMFLADATSNFWREAAKSKECWDLDGSSVYKYIFDGLE